MKKKEYERPTMQVVVLKQRPQLLAGSDVDATLYNDGAFTEEDIWCPQAIRVLTTKKKNYNENKEYLQDIGICHADASHAANHSLQQRGRIRQQR